MLRRDLDRIDLDVDRAEVRELDLRAHVDLGGELEEFAVFDLGDLDLGLADGLHAGAGDSLGVTRRQSVVDDLLEHSAATDTRFEEAGRSLAGTEAGETNLLREGLVGLVEIRLEFREGHLNVDTDSRRAELLDGALHETSLLRLVLLTTCVESVLLSGAALHSRTYWR